MKKEDKSNSYHCKHPRERRRIEAANSKLADYMQSDICLDLYDSVFDDDDDYDTYMGQLFMTILSISFVKKVDGLRKICRVSASLR